MDAIAYNVLQNALRGVNGLDTDFARAIKSDVKGKLSAVLCLCGIALAFVSPAIADAIYVIIAIWWIVPDRRFEPVIAGRR
jgi:hypothetical protein